MRQIKTVVALGFIALTSAAFAASSNTTISATAAKPAVALGALSAIDSSDDTTAITALTFGSGALTRGAETDASTALKFKLASYDNAATSQSYTLAFSMPTVTGYTFKYKLDGGTSAAVADLNGTLPAGNSASATYVVSGGAVAAAGSATTVLFTVTADGSASTNLSGNITVTLTAN